MGPGFNSKEPDLNNSSVIINISSTNIGKIAHDNEQILLTNFALLNRPILCL